LIGGDKQKEGVDVTVVIEIVPFGARQYLIFATLILLDEEKIV
jgi:hypothetical protein